MPSSEHNVSTAPLRFAHRGLDMEHDDNGEWVRWEDVQGVITTRDRYREWVSRIWVGAEQEMWDERHGPGSWQLDLKRAYRERAKAAEAEADRLRLFIADFVGDARREHHIA